MVVGDAVSIALFDDTGTVVYGPTPAVIRCPTSL